LLTLFLGIALANEIPLTTGRTPIGEMKVETSTVRMVQEDLEIRLMNLDEYEVRATYRLHNPSAEAVVHFAVPITSGGEQGTYRDSSAAASVRILSDGNFVPCLVQQAPGFDTPYPQAKIDRWCTADLTIPAGPSEIRLSYEGELIYNRVLSDQALVPAPADRTLLYALASADSWAKKPDEVSITVDLGPYKGRASIRQPDGPDVSGRFISWALNKPELAKTPWIEIGLRAADWDRHAIATALNQHPSRWAPTITGSPDTAPLTDANAATAWCGPSGSTLKLDWPLPEAPASLNSSCRAGFGYIPGDTARWADTDVQSLTLRSCNAKADAPQQVFSVTRAAQPGVSGQVAILDEPMNQALFAPWLAAELPTQPPCLELELSGTEQVCLAELAWRVRCD